MEDSAELQDMGDGCTCGNPAHAAYAMPSTIVLCAGCTDTTIPDYEGGVIAGEDYCEPCFEAYSIELEVSRIRHTAVGLIGFVAAFITIIHTV